MARLFRTDRRVQRSITQVRSQQTRCRVELLAMQGRQRARIVSGRCAAVTRKMRMHVRYLQRTNTAGFRERPIRELERARIHTTNLCLLCATTFVCRLKDASVDCALGRAAHCCFTDKWKRDWCGWSDSNRHGFPHYPLKVACLPVPPHPHRKLNCAGRSRAVVLLSPFARTTGLQSSWTARCCPNWANPSVRQVPSTQQARSPAVRSPNPQGAPAILSIALARSAQPESLPDPARSSAPPDCAHPSRQA